MGKVEKKVTDFQDIEKPQKDEKPVFDQGSAANMVLIIGGPTASGKSDLAMRLAETFDGVIINGDSMQVYADLRILTARPSAEDERRVPHRLFGVLPASERCSVGRWLDMAETEIQQAWAVDRLPIVVGGTGMYLRSLMEGLAPVPTVPDEFVAAAEALYDAVGGEAFRGRLADLDAETAAKLPPGDRQRLIRAYSVAKGTGNTLGHWQAKAPARPGLGARFVTILIMPERAKLYAACDGRFKSMLERGAIDEVRRLGAQGLSTRLPAMRALGVPELLAYGREEMTLEMATEKAQQATRNFAKRQMTWFRNQLRPDTLIETLDAAAAQDTITFLQSSDVVRDR